MPKRFCCRVWGGDEVIEAIKSRKNEVEVGNTVHSNMDLFVIYDEELNFSPRLGHAVHGILGYDFFKDSLWRSTMSVNFRKYMILKIFGINFGIIIGCPSVFSGTSLMCRYRYGWKTRR